MSPIKSPGVTLFPGSRRQRPEPLEIEVKYDRTRLIQDEVVTGTAKIRNNLDKTAKMVMVDLGIPPGFSAGKIQYDGDAGNPVF